MIWSGFAFAQNFDWLINTKSNFSEISNDMIEADSNHLIIIGNYASFIQFNSDSSRNGISGQNAFVAKIRTNDSTIEWMKSYPHCNLLFIEHWEGRYFIVAKTIDTFQNIHNAYFFAEMDNSGNIVQTKAITNTTSFVGIKGVKASPINNSLIVYAFKSPPTGIFNGVGTPTGNNAIICYVDSNWNTKWLRTASLVTLSDCETDETGNVYFNCVLSSPNPSFGSISFTVTTGDNDMCLVKYDKNGNLIWVNRIGGSNVDQGNAITYNKGSLYFSGTTSSILNINGNTLTPKPTGQANAIVGIMDTAGNYKNVFLINGTSISVFDLSVNVYGEVYLIGSFQYNVKLGMLQLTDGRSSNKIFLLKLDKSLAPLWLVNTKGGGSINRVLSNDKRESFFYGSIYSTQMTIGPFSKNFGSLSNNIFLLKLSDISITRLPLSKTKYCTGDSIFVPYTLTGKYRAGNKFTAQLSDTAGNFDTLTTNLGFRLDTLAGTIACKIPNTVLNSTQYRIRVYSDSPGVFSFYDTSQYSIYQTPVVKAINDTLLCYGQKVELGNNGTAVSYKWFPKIAVDDSSNLFAKNTVKQPTQFVLAGYNNYCPAYDTLNLSFRSSLKVSSLAHDTLHCYNDSLSVPVTFFGGDSLQRKLLWFNTTNLFFSDSSNAVRVSNNIVKKILSNTDTSNIKIVLTDGCSEQVSVQFLYRLRNPLSVQLPTDITVCNGASVVLKIQNYKADSAAYSFRWKDAATQTLLSASDSLLKSYNQTQKIKIESKFVCNSTPDSGFVNISVLPPLQVLVNNDTALCYGRTLLLKAVANGGNIPNHQFNWLDLTDNLSLAINTDTFTHKALKTKKIAVELYDNCSIGNDFDTILITVLPRLQAQIVKDTNVCEGKQTVICSKANGGISNQYLYEWADLNSLILSTDSFLILSNAQQLFYTLSLKDNCSLPLIISDTFAPLSSPKAIFTIDTVFCEKQLLNIQNTSNYQSGSVFSWNFGNGIKQQIFEPNYFYIDSGLYKITLTIQQKNACADSLSINNIQINPKPQAQFTANKTTADLSQAQFQFINQSAKASTFLWTFGDGVTSLINNPSHTFTDFGIYDVELIASNIYECSDTLLKKQFIEVFNEYKVYFPTAFSPNSDNLNDSFKPIGFGFKDYEITVFNRWGIEVFHSNPAYKDFIGNDFNNNPLPTETYPFIMNVTAKDGKIRFYKGTIILLR